MPDYVGSKPPERLSIVYVFEAWKSWTVSESTCISLRAGIIGLFRSLQTGLTCDTPFIQFLERLGLLR